MFQDSSHRTPPRLYLNYLNRIYRPTHPNLPTRTGSQNSCCFGTRSVSRLRSEITESGGSYPGLQNGKSPL